MNRSKRGLWSYAAAAMLALITLAVFARLQNFGPESTVRRFHSVTERIAARIPPQAHYSPEFARRVEAGDLNLLTTGGYADPNVAALVDAVIRPAAFAHASFEIIRVTYKDSNTALVVVKYQSESTPQAGFFVWIVEFRNQGWRINAAKTVEAAQTIRGNMDTIL